MSNYSLAAREPRACKYERCGKIFTPPKRHSTYCSQSCSQIGRTTRVPKIRPEERAERGQSAMSPDLALLRAKRLVKDVAEGHICLQRVSKELKNRYNEAKDLIRKENKCRSN